MAAPHWLDTSFTQVIKWAGALLPKQPVIELLGAGVSLVENDPVNKVTKVTITGGGGSGADPVADTAALRAVTSGSRADKQVRLVEAKGVQERFDTDTGANEGDDGERVTKPTDLSAASNGRWFPMGTRRSVGTALLASVFASNPAPAAAGAQQYSPAVLLAGNGWGTDLSTSTACEWAVQVRPEQSGVPKNVLHFLSQTGGNGWNAQASLDADGFFKAVTYGAPNGAPEFRGSPVTWRDGNGSSAAVDVWSATGACSRTIAAGASSYTWSWTQDATAAGGALTIAGQQGAAGSIGGKVTIQAGYGGTPGTNLAGGVDIDLGATVTNASSALRLLAGSGAPIGTIKGTGYLQIENDGTGGPANNGVIIKANGVGILTLQTGGGSSIVSVESGSAQFTLATGALNYYRSGLLARSDVYHNAGANTLTWAAGVTSVTHSFTDKTAASTTAAALELKAQTTTGTTSAGGAMILRAGDGTSAGGSVQLHCGKDTVGTNHGAFEIWNRGYSNDNPQVSISKTDANFKITGNLVLGDVADLIQLKGDLVEFLGVAEDTAVSAGAASALPATPATYFQIRINGNAYYVPAYNNT